MNNHYYLSKLFSEYLFNEYLLAGDISNRLLKKTLAFDKDLSIQIVSIDFKQHNVEKLLFEKHLHAEYFVDYIERVDDNLTLLKEDKNFEKFKKLTIERRGAKKEFKTDKLGLSCIRYLAHSYYKNEILPEEWRELIKE